MLQSPRSCLPAECITTRIALAGTRRPVAGVRIVPAIFAIPMDTWKPSTLFALVAFVCAIVLLIYNAEELSRRDTPPPHTVDSEIYSPAAYDPDLRTPELAERIKARAKPRAKATSQRQSVAPAEAKSPPVVAQETAPPTKEEPVPPKPAPKSKDQNLPQGHEYLVIVGTYSQPENANRALQAFAKTGAGNPFVGTFNEGTRYSVVAQSFTSEAEARTFVQRLRDDYSWNDAFINYIGD